MGEGFLSVQARSSVELYFLQEVENTDFIGAHYQNH
jgi:hypothetical protein